MDLLDKIQEQQSKLSTKIAIRILLFSGFITLLITLFQLNKDYNKDVSNLTEGVKDISKVNLNSLALA